MTHPLKVSYILENSCGSFVEFENEKACKKTIDVKLKLLYEGCNCDLEFFDLKQDSAGTYTYKFFLDEKKFDAYNLEVYD